MMTGMTKRVKIQLAVLSVLLVIVAALLIQTSRDPLAKFKVSDEVAVGTAEKNYIAHVLDLIEKNNMGAMYKEMANMRMATFVGRFPHGLFREQDFCPAEIVGASRKRITRENNIDIYVKSVKRNKVYCFSLLGMNGGFKIGNILESEDKRFNKK